MKTGFTEPPPKPTAGYREQGSHYPRAHWFILHSNSDTWYRCSYVTGVPVLAMAYLDIVEAHSEIELLPKAICLPSKQDWQWFCIEWRLGLFAYCYKTQQKNGSQCIFWLPDTILYLTSHVRLFYLNSFKLNLLLTRMNSITRWE